MKEEVAMIPQTECYTKELEVSRKKCRVNFDKEEQSTEGGLIFIAKLEEKQNLAKRLSEMIKDWRNPVMITHKIEEMLKQRIFGIIQGYEDCNDHEFLRKDPLMLLVSGRETNEPLASQPTLTRLENHMDEETISRMGDFLIEDFVKSLPVKTRTVKLDIDGTSEETYGQQEFSFYNGHYKCTMFYPLIVHHYPTGRIAGAIMRDGAVNAFYEGAQLLERIIRKIKNRFRRCTIIVRADAGFGVPEIMDKLEDLDKKLGKINYILGIPGNSVLQKLAEPAMNRTEAKWEDRKRLLENYKEYHSAYYKADDWKSKRRIIYKTEMGFLGIGRSLRFTVTNIRKSPGITYKDYCLRGQSENWIGDFKSGIKGDRLSCHNLYANQFRFMLHSFAYNLMNELRLSFAGTSNKVMRLFNFRLKLLKISVWIKKTARVIHLHLPKNYPYKRRWMELLTLLA